MSARPSETSYSTTIRTVAGIAARVVVMAAAVASTAGVQVRDVATAISNLLSSPLGAAVVALVVVLLSAVGVRTLVLPRMSALQRDRLERLIVAILPVLILAVVVADAVWRNPTEAAALGTATAIGYVAYQSWHTRRAADAAVRGLVTAEHALRVSQAMAAEAEKRRLDQRAPAVRVSIGDPSWPPCAARQFVGSEAAPLPAGHIYRLPKNASDRLGAWAEGQVSNEGSATVDVELRGVRLFVELPGVAADTPGRSPWSEPEICRRSLGPGETLRFRLQGECPVSDWIADHRAAEQNRIRKGTVDDPVLPLAAVIRGEVVVDDGDDNGVIDRWSLTLTGEPLEPVPDEAESWQIPKLPPGREPISATVGRRRRTYWRSKERGLELPTPEV